MNIIKITDANNKEFSIDLNKVVLYTNDDMNSETNKIFTSTTDYVKDDNILKAIEIVNSDGSKFDITSITDSQTMSEILDIDVYIEASHSDTEINNAFYSSDSMMRDAASYINPFKKPLISNHDAMSEPIGRIIEADCIDSAILDGSKAINIVSKVSDKDAIPKFLDGRYSTVSIGAYPKTITCNHCGKHILKDGRFKFCGHWRGESYDDKKCTWKMEDLEYSELSVVNMPADKMAQVYKIKVNTKESLRQQNSQDNIANQIINSINDNNTDNTVDEHIVEPILDDNSIENNGISCSNEKLYSEEEYMTLLDQNMELKNENTILKADNDMLSNDIITISNKYIDSMQELVSKFDDSQEFDNKDYESVCSAYNNALEKVSIETKQTSVTVTPDNISLNVKNVSDVGLQNQKDPNVIVDNNTDTNGDNVKEAKKAYTKNELESFLNLYN